MYVAITAERSLGEHPLGVQTSLSPSFTQKQVASITAERSLGEHPLGVQTSLSPSFTQKQVASITEALPAVRVC